VLLGFNESSSVINLNKFLSLSCFSFGFCYFWIIQLWCLFSFCFTCSVCYFLRTTRSAWIPFLLLIFPLFLCDWEVYKTSVTRRVLVKNDSFRHLIVLGYTTLAWNIWFEVWVGTRGKYLKLIGFIRNELFCLLGAYSCYAILSGSVLLNLKNKIVFLTC